MKTIVSFGACGERVASFFRGKKSYNVKCISDKPINDDTIRFPTVSWEQWITDIENRFPNDLMEKLGAIDREVAVILRGGSDISIGACMFLDKIKDHDIDIIFLKTEANKKQDFLFQLLQEKTRHGSYSNMFIFDSAKIQKQISGLTLKNLHDKVNSQVATSYQQYDWCRHSAPSVSFVSETKEYARICSLTVINKENALSMSELEQPLEADIRYLVPSTVFDKDEGLIDRIKVNNEKIKSVVAGNISHAIYETPNEDQSERAIVCYKTQMIQGYISSQ